MGREKTRKPILAWLFLALATIACIGWWTVQQRRRHADRDRQAQVDQAAVRAGDDLSEAVAAGDTLRVTRLLQENEYASSVLDFQLSNATASGKAKVVALLLDHGCNPNGRRNDGHPLTYAASMRQDEIVELLLRRGAKAENPSNDITPLLWAVTHNRTKMARILLDAGANVNAQAVVLLRPPHPRSRRGTPGYPPLSKHPKARQFRKRYVTPLMLAAWAGYPDMVRLLLKHDPDLRAVTHEGETALDLARGEGYDEIVASLSRHSSRRP